MWNIWVNNCVEKIREILPPSRWFFVLIGLNPADVDTHPVILENIDFDFWLKGSQFFWVIVKTDRVKRFCCQKRRRNCVKE